jgi:4'-phosphopantetheinyl transferase
MLLIISPAAVSRSRNGMGADILLYTSPFGGERDQSHRLLRQAVTRYTGRDGDWSIALGEKGKPFFPTSPEVCFSISHSGAWWMCALSSQPVGLDVQDHHPMPREKLSRRFFHPEEDAYLQARGYTPFFDVWAAKESYLKYTGQGITDDLRAFSVTTGGTFPLTQGAELRLLSWRADYSLCVCAQAIGCVTFTTL